MVTQLPSRHIGASGDLLNEFLLVEPTGFGTLRKAGDTNAYDGGFRGLSSAYKDELYVRRLSPT